MYTASLKKGHEYYYCTNGKHVCEAHTCYLRSEPATELVADALDAVRLDTEIIDIMHDSARERAGNATLYTESIQQRLKGQLETLERQEIAAFNDSSLGILRRELYEQKMLEIKNNRLMAEKELRELELQNGLATLEPIRNAFIRGNTVRNRFLDAEPEQQKIIASEVLWNLLVQEGKTEQVRYRSYYDVMAKAPKNGDFAKMCTG